MRAVRIHQRGGFEELRYEEAPLPKLAADEVLIRVRASALNHLDLMVRDGPWSAVAPFPLIPGLEAAGEVAEAGKGVSGVSTGERVLVSPTIACGKCAYCRSEQDNLCKRLRIFGLHMDGGYAEYVKAPAGNLIPLPSHLSYAEAAATPVAFGTAWHMLVRRAALKPEDVVLVLAAGSGVGSAALQIAKYFGCRVIATVGSDAKLEKARALGADETINHSSEPVRPAALRMTGRRGVDVVVEHVGGDTWESSLASLAPNGRLVTCGTTTGRMGPTDIQTLFLKQLTVIGCYAATRKDFLTVFELVSQGKLKPVIDRCFPLREAAAAQQYLANREQFGKVLLSVETD
jgi:NADPH:quinone reductase-like Zn-dependent oxidoreductase